MVGGIENLPLYAWMDHFMRHPVTVHQSIFHNLVVVAAEAMAPADPPTLASFCIVITLPQFKWRGWQQRCILNIGIPNLQVFSLFSVITSVSEPRISTLTTQVAYAMLFELRLVGWDKEILIRNKMARRTLSANQGTIKMSLPESSTEPQGLMYLNEVYLMKCLQISRTLNSWYRHHIKRACIYLHKNIIMFLTIGYWAKINKKSKGKLTTSSVSCNFTSTSKNDSELFVSHDMWLVMNAVQRNHRLKENFMLRT